MDYLVVTVATLLVSALALYSGFGLGTLLMPVFALFFPLPIAIASTAVVHLANNLFKVVLLGKKADWGIVLAFGLPALIFSIPGALLLVNISEIAPIATYHIGERYFEITTIKIVLSFLILGFSLFELIPAFNKVNFPRNLVPIGGSLSGFFGGLSGHQGALRSAVLAKTNLDPSVFAATISICAFLVDTSRLLIYGVTFFARDFLSISESNSAVLVGTATLAAFLGTYTSSRFLKKITKHFIRNLVGIMLVAIGLALGSGLI